MRLQAALIGLALTISAAADEEWDKVLLLQRVKRHIAESVRKLPDYTCLQTAARYRKADENAREQHGDTVVLEVLNAGQKELYAPPGARAFDRESPGALTAGGLSGTGSFGLFLRTLFVNDNAIFQYKGEAQSRGRRALRWDYRVPRTWSGYDVRLDFARGIVGMRGTFMVDPESLDLLHLSVLADEVPPNLPLFSAAQTIEYAPARIGDRDVNLPQTATMKIIETSGAQSRNVVEFTHCQSFRVESKLSFTVPEGEATKAAPPQEARPLAAGLTVPIELAAPITGAHTVGMPIEGRVPEHVRERGKVAIAPGSAVRGRVRRLEFVDDSWAVGLEFTEIETETGAQRFYANLEDLPQKGGVRFLLRSATPNRRGDIVEQRWLPYLPGVAQFFVDGKELNLPKGFRTVWKTTSPRSAIR